MVVDELRKLREDRNRTESAVNALSRRGTAAEARVPTLSEIRDATECNKKALDKFKKANWHTLIVMRIYGKQKETLKPTFLHGHHEGNETWDQPEDLLVNVSWVA